MSTRTNAGQDSENEKTVVSGSDNTFNKKNEAAAQTPPCLIVLIGPPAYVGKQWLLTTPKNLIGRHVECQIFIEDRTLSRNHASFDFDGDAVTVTDVGSVNGTKVNGTELAKLSPCLLRNNDQIRTGNVVFKYLERGSLEALSTKEVIDKVSKDSMTGAYTRGELVNRGPEFIRRAEDLKEPLSFVIFDIDFFKKINDAPGIGHPGGDYVLKEIGQVVANRVLRTNDYFVRYGGEEFIVLLSGSDAKQALEVAERLRLTIQDHEFVYAGQRLYVTISLGVTMKKVTDKVWEALYDRADKALFASKNNGRNRVTFG